MSVIVLGLDHRLLELRRMGAITYNYWHSAGLTNVDPILANLRPDEFKRAFEDAASSANGITFDLTDVDIDRAIQNGSRRFVRHNYTNALTIRLESPFIEGNLHLVCSGCRYIKGPFHWHPSSLEILPTKTGDIQTVQDATAGFELHCEVVGCQENVEPVYRLATPAAAVR